jgi:hypothetical protein
MNKTARESLNSEANASTSLSTPQLNAYAGALAAGCLTSVSARWVPLSAVFAKPCRSSTTAEADGNMPPVTRAKLIAAPPDLVLADG